MTKLTLRAPLSGTFLQTLPDLVMPLKGHSLFPRLKPRRNSSSFFSSFLSGVDASRVYMRAWELGCFYSHISTQTFRRALTASVDSCAEIKSDPSVAELNLAEFGGRCRKAVLGVWTALSLSSGRSSGTGPK